MKPISESSETFTAYATIDAGYYMLQELQKILNKRISPIDKAVDVATGYMQEQHKRIRKQCIEIVKDIIAAKKVIEADYSGDEKLLATLKSLKIK